MPRRWGSWFRAWLIKGVGQSSPNVRAHAEHGKNEGVALGKELKSIAVLMIENSKLRLQAKMKANKTICNPSQAKVARLLENFRAKRLQRLRLR